MVVCALTVVLGLVLALRWRNYAFVVDSRIGAPWAVRLRGLAHLLATGYLTGLVTGALFIGPAGRLVMRLLAATSPDAQGFTTDADEEVGKITVTGTLGLITFFGLGFGVGVGLVYVFVSLAFPRGLLGGAIYGGTLLVLFSWWLDPLRANNLDFDFLGPGWLAVAAFAAMAVLAGVVTAAVAGRIDAVLLQSPRRWVWWTVPMGILGAPVALGLAEVWPALAVIVVGCAMYLSSPMTSRVLRHKGRVTLQALVGVTILTALPGFLAAVLAIA